jgi:tellurite resistance protein
MGDIEQARHIVELMVLTAWADGRVVGSEALAIHKLTVTFPELRDVGPTGEISARAKNRLERVGMEAAVREAAGGVKDPRYREIAFQCCAKVSGADGVFVPEESAVLAELQELFGYSEEDVKRLLVLATRQISSHLPIKKMMSRRRSLARAAGLHEFVATTAGLAHHSGSPWSVQPSSLRCVQGV